MIGRKRELWLDVLRILAAFLVIVNHTNSNIFIHSTPEHGEWWASISWYTISKIAVPLFVMVSGAALLPKQDSWPKFLGRLGRVAAALLVFSYLHFLHDAWVYYGLWPRMMRLDVFFAKVWTQDIADQFWYLYFYIGLLLMLPILQRLAAGMKKGDARYLIGLCFGLGALWPLITHYLPGLALPSYFSAPVFTTMIGLFFTGWQLRQMPAPSRKQMNLAAVVMVACFAVNVLLMRLEFDRVSPGEEYWFIDDRQNPALLTVIAAIACAVLCRGWMNRPMSEKRQNRIIALGATAFGVYLIHGKLLDLTVHRIYDALCGVMPAFPAVLIWEAAVFAVSVGLTLLLRRLPVFRKIL